MTHRKHRKPRPPSRLTKAVAALTMTAAAVGGAVALTDDTVAPPADTTWGAPNTADDTTWGTPPADSGDEGGSTVTPQDTTWG